MTFSRTKMLHGMFHKTYAQTIQYAHDEHSSVTDCGYSEGRILHGRRYYPAPPPITETCNYPIQRSAGEMGAITMLAIADSIKREKLPAKILTNEHDAGTIEFKKSKMVESALIDIIRAHAEGPWDIEGAKHRFPVSCHTGHTWAEACAD